MITSNGDLPLNPLRANFRKQNRMRCYLRQRQRQRVPAAAAAAAALFLCLLSVSSSGRQHHCQVSCAPVARNFSPISYLPFLLSPLSSPLSPLPSPLSPLPSLLFCSLIHPLSSSPYPPSLPYSLISLAGAPALIFPCFFSVLRCVCVAPALS